MPLPVLGFFAAGDAGDEPGIGDVEHHRQDVFTEGERILFFSFLALAYGLKLYLVNGD